MRQRNEKKRYQILEQVKGFRKKMEQLSDEALSGLTVKFRRRLKKGETLDDLLPEAFAAVCEADRRILGMFPFAVQILGGIALHQGCFAEMNTGEGKTLTATMPLYLNALSGKSTILVTTNEYLALRDAEEMGPVYRFMGLTTAVGVRADGKPLTNKEKKEIYAADIVYTTHGVLGFDYLLNNLVTSAQDRFLRDFDYVIIDEADSVLLDGAQMPLVISGAPRVQSNLYAAADFFVSTLREGRDYETEDKKVWLTEEGVAYAEQFFRIDNFYSREHFEINRHVILALRAHALFEKEKEYLISKEGELYLLDGGSGRILPGVKLRGGQHQALEVKEKLPVSPENRSVASITYQSLFRLFPKMAGMSGTIFDAKEELMEVYGAEVTVIPPNRPVQRKDLQDRYFRNAEEQLQAALVFAEAVHATGRPVLIVAASIRETKRISEELIRKGIPHNLLNANNAFWEADMIKEAGRKHAVTVATSMAGRGTDIRLGKGVKKHGGLMVVGIGRMKNKRQEKQARGRAGRQGDPGSSCFFVSLQDEVVRENAPENPDRYIKGEKKIRERKLKKIIDAAPETAEEFAALSRRQAMDYDGVLQRQRNLIYQTRDRLLDGNTLKRKRILEIAAGNIRRFLESEKNMDIHTVGRYILDNISYRLDDDLDDMVLHERQSVGRYLLKKATSSLREQERNLGGREPMNDFIRVATLRAIDDAWIEQVDYLQQLQAAVSGRISAQRNPLFEYQREARCSFGIMEETIYRNLIRNILLSNVSYDTDGKLVILFP